MRAQHKKKERNGSRMAITVIAILAVATFAGWAKYFKADEARIGREKMALLAHINEIVSPKTTWSLTKLVERKVEDAVRGEAAHLVREQRRALERAIEQTERPLHAQLAEASRELARVEAELGDPYRTKPIKAEHIDRLQRVLTAVREKAQTRYAPPSAMEVATLCAMMALFATVITAIATIIGVALAVSAIVVGGEMWAKLSQRRQTNNA